ncbi:hypothetical protein BI308_18060 [Roseofilum reptotaenium AO1-A]|uniref:Uncharacterized protein n=1 Tax=Roseofilum reptotaenium AO1-A TaxID=1925591 RepID=A0A1L9QNF1_9CYAN|nr:hypothetical protein BI308_18060 [Roseofilum reptotaenium AO1-A]
MKSLSHAHLVGVLKLALDMNEFQPMSQLKGDRTILTRWGFWETPTGLAPTGEGFRERARAWLIIKG